MITPRIILLLFGWLILFAHSYLLLLPALLQHPHYSHIPLLFFAIIYLLYRQRQALTHLPEQPPTLLALTLIFGGLIMAAIGQRLQMPLLIFGSHLPLAAGIIAWFKGVAGLKQLRVELAFMLWLWPLPAFWLEQITQPLRNGLTQLACYLLQHIGYPASANGALLFMGPYRLFVEDACSGLHSIQTLCAIGMLYLYCQGAKRRQLLWALGGLVVLALAGNLLRILVLSLLTYHLGDLNTRAWHGMISALIFLSLCIALLHWQKPNTCRRLG